MKKVLLAFDGAHFSKGVLAFAKQMNKHQPLLATGLFLPSVDYVELLYSFGGVPAGPLYINEVVPADDSIIQKHITALIKFCVENGIQYQIHMGFTKHVVAQVKEETRFADLLVMSSKLFYENLGEDEQDEYIENAVHKAECAVVLVPENYKEPENIVMAYDGSEQSVYAIKQFTYLFPEFRDRQVLVVYLDKGKSDLPERTNIEELLSGHYPHFAISRLKINPKEELENWLINNRNSILVAGAFGRSLFSEMFRRSFISEVIHGHKVPIFVAHK